MSVEQAYKAEVRALQEEYGKYNVPLEKMLLAADRLRAHHVMGITHLGTVSTVAHLRQYGIAQSIIDSIVDETGLDADEAGKKRKDKYKLLQTWAVDNVGAQITIPELAEISEFSISTATKYVNDHPDVFVRVKRGLYDVRDPKAERERELQRAS